MKRCSTFGRNRAIVVGGSMAGLITARALADHFCHVELLERDDLGAADDYRSGVPQANHSHVLLAGGKNVLEAYYPGISSDLEAEGAIRGDVARDVRWFVEGGRLSRFSSGLDGFGMSRSLLEGVVRARTGDSANVTIRGNTRVDGIVFASDNRRVVGVRSGGTTYDADFVVDASGRGSRTPRWLEEHGHRRAPEERVEIELRYTTRLFRRRPNDLHGDHAAIIPPTSPGKRGGGMVAQERDRWIVTLITHFGDFAPSDLVGFVAFARTFPDRSIFDVIRDAEPIGEAHTIRVPASIRRRYERLKRFPVGYAVIGDAISSFNPIYGQGMSVAALEATALAAAFEERHQDVTKRFFDRAARIVDTAWAIAAGNDLRMPEATGKRRPGVTLTNLYVPRLLRAGHRDPRTARAFLEVSNLLAPPRRLLRPSLVWRAMSPRIDVSALRGRR